MNLKDRLLRIFLPWLVLSKLEGLLADYGMERDQSEMYCADLTKAIDVRGFRFDVESWKLVEKEAPKGE